MKKSVFLFALFCFFLTNLFSQEQNQNGAAPDYASSVVGAENLLIAKFNIDGLKRTKRSYMDSLLADFIGKPVSAGVMKLIDTKLQAQNLFDQIKLSARAVSESEAEVNISFKEKWSFLPMPVGYYTGDTLGAGLFVLDMNALGQHCMAMIGGLYSSSSIMGAFAFQKAPVQKGKLGFAISGSGSKSIHQIANAANYRVYEYENYYGGVRTNLLLKPSSATYASVGAGYSFLKPIDSPSIPTINQWSVSASWGISDSSWNGYFVSSNSFKVGTEILFSDNPKQHCAQTVNFEGQVQRVVVPKIRLMTNARGFFSNDLYVTNYTGRGSSGVTLLPGKFATPQIFGLLSGLEAVVAKAKFGMLTVYGLYSVAVARDWNKTLYACHGPEAGVRLYLAKLAFPAFAMGASYNITENRFQYSFSGGASF